MHRGREETIRLHGMDAPERGQGFSNRAKQFVSGLCFGKEVSVKPHGQDRYGRTIGEVMLGDGGESESGNRERWLGVVVETLCAERHRA